MNSYYFPVVENPMPRIQTDPIQTPFYFGGNQVMINLNPNPLTGAYGTGFKPNNTIIEGDQKGYKSKIMPKPYFK
jgi:hypothetical protein